MMDTATRLAGIEARCKALGWRFQNVPSGFTLIHPSTTGKRGYTIGRYDFGRWELGFQAAERLLSCYEPGHTIKIRYDPDERLDPCKHCDLNESDDCGNVYCTLNYDQSKGSPPKDCPGNGTHKLIPVEVDDV